MAEGRPQEEYGVPPGCRSRYICTEKAPAVKGGPMERSGRTGRYGRNGISVARVYIRSAMGPCRVGDGACLLVRNPGGGEIGNAPAGCGDRGISRRSERRARPRSRDGLRRGRIGAASRGSAARDSDAVDGDGVSGKSVGRSGKRSRAQNVAELGAAIVPCRPETRRAGCQKSLSLAPRKRTNWKIATKAPILPP